MRKVGKRDKEPDGRSCVKIDKNMDFLKFLWAKSCMVQKNVVLLQPKIIKTYYYDSKTFFDGSTLPCWFYVGKL